MVEKIQELKKIVDIQDRDREASKFVKRYYESNPYGEKITKVLTEEEVQYLTELFMSNKNLVYAKHMLMNGGNMTIRPMMFEKYMDACVQHTDIEGAKYGIQRMMKVKGNISSEVMDKYLEITLETIKREKIDLKKQMKEKGVIERADKEEDDFHEGMDYDVMLSYRAVEEVMEMYKKLNVPMRMNTIQMLVGHFLNVFDFEMAKKLMNVFHEQLGRETMIEIGKYYIYQGLNVKKLANRSMEMIHWLKSLDYLDVGTVHSAFLQFLEMKDLAHSKEMFHLCAENSIIPSRDVLGEYLDLLLAHRQIDEAGALLFYMIDKQKPPTSAHFFSFFDAILRKSSVFHSDLYPELIAPYLESFYKANIPLAMELKYGLLKCVLLHPCSPEFMDYFLSFLQRKPLKDSPLKLEDYSQ